MAMPEKMNTRIGDAVAEAARLALEIGSAAADVVSLMADLGEELPVLEPILKTLKAIRETANDVKQHHEEITMLKDRCSYMTACFIVKCRQNPDSAIVVTPLEDCIEAVGTFIERCSRRGKLSRLLKASSDKDEIAELNIRLNLLTSDLSLAGIATLEGKAHDMTAMLERMGNNQKVMMTHLKRTAPKLARVPRGTPIRKSWHVERHHVVGTVLEAFSRDGGTRLVGLVGRSGAGKTTAASEIVRSTKAQEAFPDGMVWLSVNKFAKDRLPSLLLQLARMVFEHIAHRVGDPPAPSADGTAYIKKLLGRGGGGSELKCLVVADNVWDEEVISGLLRTGMWVLLSTRDKGLISDANGEAVGVDELSDSDAQSVLKKAAELPPEARLPDDALDLIDLCGRVAMDLAFVGRWSMVRGRQDRAAWSTAAGRVRQGLRTIRKGSGADSTDDTRMKQRKAILQAGFEDLGSGSDDDRVQQLYLSLGVLPDGHPFTKKDAATLLYDHAASVDDEASAGGVLDTLERWAVVQSEEGIYRMHDTHSGFARESLDDRRDVHKRALRRWGASISSLDALLSTDTYVLKRLWLAVEDVGGQGWAQTRPYTKALNEMGVSHPSYRDTIHAVAKFEKVQKDLKGASATWRRLLEAERRDLGDYHPYVLNTYRILARCAKRLGNTDEAVEWRAMERKGLLIALANAHERIAAGGVNGLDGEEALASIASTASKLTLGHKHEREMVLRQSLSTKEFELGPDDLQLCVTLHELSTCVRETGRLDEGEELMRRCLRIYEIKLGPKDLQVAATLHLLGSWARETGRLAKAEELLRRCLAIKEAKLGPEDARVCHTLSELGICVRDAGRLDEADELMQRCLAYQEVNPDPEGDQVAITLHLLGLWAHERGYLHEAEGLLRHCLAIREAKLGSQDMRVAKHLHQLGLSVRQAGRPDETEGLLRRTLTTQQIKPGPEGKRVADILYHLGEWARKAGRLDEAERLLKRCLVITEATLGTEDAQVAYTLHQLGACVRTAGRPDEAEVLLRRCLVIKEATLGRETMQVAVTLDRLGLCVREAGRVGEAEKLLRRSLGIKEANRGLNSRGVGITLFWLGMCTRDAGNVDEAEGMLRRCLAIEETKSGQNDLNLAVTLHELGVSVRGSGRLAEAAGLFRRCLGIVEAMLDIKSEGVTDAWQTPQGKGARLQEKLEQARSLSASYFVMENVEPNRRNDDADTVLHDLGTCLLEARRSR